MATPASLFRARPTMERATADLAEHGGSASAMVTPLADAAFFKDRDAAVEFELVVPPSGNIPVAGQQVWVGRQFAGQTVTIWAGLISIHLVLHGVIFKTVASRLSEIHLHQLLGRGGRPAEPAPAPAALPAGGPLPPAVASN